MRCDNGRPLAVARIHGGTENRELKGTVRFYQKRDGVLVYAYVTGLPGNGFYGFHIHEGGSCSGTGFSDTLGHYNPTNAPHPMHFGDLPPLLSASGTAKMTVLTNRFRICEILGKTVVIHSKSDDFRTQPAGDAGEKIGCGVIRTP